MGIAPYKYFTFDGESSRDYDVYLTGTGVFNAPQRAVDLLEIPGRNGNYALDQGRFNNITITYKAGIVDYSEADFADKVSAVRNWLCSKVGYVRLSDDYNPDEYRMAVFKNGITVDHDDLRTGEFDITFECKPQRWLTSGETPRTIGSWGETTTVSGDIVQFNALATDKVKSLVADIDPVQDLNGYDKPWVGGGGKNKLPPFPSYSANGATFTANTDGSTTATATSVSGNSNNTLNVDLPAGTYYLTMNATSYSTRCRLRFRDSSNTVMQEYQIIAGNEQVSFTVASAIKYINFTVSNGATDINVTIKPQLETDGYTAWQPYSNICPISGWDGCDIDNNGTTVSVSWSGDAGTVYGGYVDVVSGELTVTKKYITPTSVDAVSYSSGGGVYFCRINLVDYAPSNNVAHLISNLFKTQSSAVIGNCYVTNSGKSIVFVLADQTITTTTDADAWCVANSPQFCYDLATPTTYTLTPTQIDLLVGQNTISVDCGATTLEYGTDPSVVINPTPFESEPLLAIKGYGTIDFNGYEVEIENGDLGTIQLASETDITQTSVITLNNVAALLNVGDDIYFVDDPSRPGGYSYSAWLKKGDYYSSGVLTSSSNVASTPIISFPSHNPDIGIMSLKPDTSAGFKYGTSSTITSTAVFDCTLTDSSTLTLSISMAYAYDGSDKITVTRTLTASGTYSHISYMKLFCDSGSIPEVYGDSTKTLLGNPTYIDCDIGECYKYEGGEIVSLNEKIALGSDLPKLSSGTNTFTYDNTVTELKVTPRWWKV